jgi:hypothetical protein
MRRLYRFFALPGWEWALVVKAALLLTIIRLGLGRIAFTTLHRLVAGARRAGHGPTDARALSDSVVWAVDAVSRRLPGRTTCLARALTVQALLARMGYVSRLRVGVVRGQQGQLEAHAWVDDHGRVLTAGGRADIEPFTRIAVFDVGGVDTTFAPTPMPTLPGAR